MKYLTIIFLLVFTLNLNSQTLAPDITLTDIHGVTRNLYSELDAGKQVILEFFMTTCGTCQVNTSDLENFWQNQGYNGDSLWIWSIEINGASDSAIEAFYNQYPATFPSFSTKNDTSVINNYNVTYAPQYISICPNRIMKTVVIQSIINNDVSCPASTSAIISLFESSSFNYITEHNSLVIKLKSGPVNASVSIYSITGELVCFLSLFEKETRINLQDVNSGLYFVKVQTEGGSKVISGKIVKTD